MANVTVVYADPIAAFGESEIPFGGITVAFAVIAIAQLCAISIMSWEPRFQGSVNLRRSFRAARRKQRGARMPNEDRESNTTQVVKCSHPQSSLNRVKDLSCSNQGRRVRSDGRTLEEGGSGGDGCWRMVVRRKWRPAMSKKVEERACAAHEDDYVITLKSAIKTQGGPIRKQIVPPEKCHKWRRHLYNGWDDHARELALSRLGDESEPDVNCHTMFMWDYSHLGGCGVVENPELRSFHPWYTRNRIRLNNFVLSLSLKFPTINRSVLSLRKRTESRHIFQAKL